MDEDLNINQQKAAKKMKSPKKKRSKSCLARNNSGEYNLHSSGSNDIKSPDTLSMILKDKFKLTLNTDNKNSKVFESKVYQFGNKQIEQLKRDNMKTKTFLNMVIHDMRNPTTSIKMGLECTIDQLREISKLLDSSEFYKHNQKAELIEIDMGKDILRDIQREKGDL